ncbi:MAG: hypothetical protein IGR93_15865 [Hydrococcus sp. C42_A2020_068]|uniref:hypothetical protein n=1 Tax=Pleurocapsa sp. PCC 7327 TaxID=118163 RepID=UPI00029FEAB0|nr:hypothetical protein [Pleurocapsa sp. PCC 7327]AFY79231.1 hypothetical protein Ple7327_4096 [Pleurocapsa sp. PCC 7327]MBF2021528.1 hypothetical protein [Hydrococcus sp. C42_A2020_068]
MEDWQKDVWEMLESTADAIDRFFQDVSQETIDVAEQVKNEIESNLVQFLQNCQDFLEVAIDFENEFLFSERLDSLFNEDEDWIFQESLEEFGLTFNPKIEPSLETHPACIGCRHYHGRVYGENLLVCGMHPYGWDDRNCPDWENIQ